MKLQEAIDFFENQLDLTQSKSERKVYNTFLAILIDLGNKDLTEDEMEVIEAELSTLRFDVPAEIRKKYFKQKLGDFKKFLKAEFGLIPEGYHAEMGMSYGMVIGMSVGMVIPSVGMVIGMTIGMLIGIAYGKQKDAEAKQDNWVLPTKLK